MRGGLERWKRGVESRGVRQAIGYALEGISDAHLQHSPSIDALEAYSAASNSTVSRFIVASGRIGSDELTAGGLRVWLTGHDPITGEERGHQRLSPDADLLLDGTLNHPKSYSIAALLHPELAAEFEALQDRLRDRILLTWQTELNARRGHGGLIREEITRIEVVELRHRRSRALDPHIHRHLWLNIKVLGVDGKWSNLDSRVAMKLHTVVNAEGELATRTDPAWIAALARHGYTLDNTGEIAKLASAIRRVSRRSAQIEGNRARLTAEWSAAHNGSAPSSEVLQQIDRRAWAVSRPNKPTDLDEALWEARVHDEIAAIDPDLTIPRAAISVAATAPHAVALDLLAAQAVVDADERSTSCGGRFSIFDIRAGAIRALSRTGVVAERDRLDGVITEITERATRSAHRLVTDDPPAHVKAFMATETVRAKVRLAGRLDVLARPGRSLLLGELQRFARNEELSTLDASQRVAACAIAGTDGLVTVTGPAGAGKTTMLRAAFGALTSHRRQMLVVAPTRKAASVASREVGAAASSIHALLSGHGYRWGTDEAGAKVWTRLRVGELDPSMGAVYGGPTHYVLRSHDRIVVDEAGMVDLQTANVLVDLAIEQGVGLAFVGDTRQALPVGHAGAMGSAIRHANAAVELDTVHRFRDPDYAALTLRLRDAGDRERALAVAGELADQGHVDRVDHLDGARERMIDAYFEWHARGKRVTLVSGTNAEADAINDAIQQRRVDEGELDSRVSWGMGQQRILVGDTVQTRRNDRLTGLENRAQWTVRDIRDGYVPLISVSDSGEVRRVFTEYAREHLQLAYASTVHGVQGDTAAASVVGPDVDAAGLYVGLTRGRLSNVAIVVARTDAAARECLAESMQRGTPELTMQDAVRAAQAELRRAARNREATMATGPVVGAPSAGARARHVEPTSGDEESSILLAHASSVALATARIVRRYLQRCERPAADHVAERSDGCIFGFSFSSIAVMSTTPPYPNAPIALAIVELRGPESPPLTRAEILSLKRAVQSTLPLFATERTRGFSMEFGPAGVRPVDGGEQELVKFMTRSRRTCVTFTTTSTIIETTDYKGWSDFKRFLEVGLSARQDIAPMDGLVRLGIRIIDEVRVPNNSRPDWADWLDPSLLAPRVKSSGSELQLKQQQAVVQYGGHDRGETITVRYGAMDGPPAVTSAPNLIRPNLPAPGSYFLIDTDAAWEITDGEELPAVTSPGVVGLADKLHAPMKEIFESFITDRLRKEVFA
ncbi:uncharacterized protein (TIGR04255 family) [Microbacterium sp. BK668]|nr:TIGR04255 family protein [Microbacterium sp. BK668]TDN92218.1 uncharacterized protein (TIGR04255 family) [Microbacterium sp. BK668]